MVERGYAFAAALLLAAMLILVHHYVCFGAWFEPADYHHEDLVVLFLALALFKLICVLTKKHK